MRKGPSVKALELKARKNGLKANRIASFLSFFHKNRRKRRERMKIGNFTK